MHNGNMVRYRIAVEWAFSKITNLFARTDYNKKLKLGLPPIGHLHSAAILTSNAHICCYSSQNLFSIPFHHRHKSTLRLIVEIGSSWI